MRADCCYANLYQYFDIWAAGDFIAVRAGLTGDVPLLCGPGCGRDQCCAGRAAGETSAAGRAAPRPVLPRAAGETSAVRAGLRARQSLCGLGLRARPVLCGLGLRASRTRGGVGCGPG